MRAFLRFVRQSCPEHKPLNSATNSCLLCSRLAICLLCCSTYYVLDTYGILHANSCQVDSFTSSYLLPQDVNNILNSGEVPNLMRPEDLEEIAGVMRPLLQAQGRNPTKIAIQAAFVERVQQYLHLVLCMSPVGDAFR